MKRIFTLITALMFGLSTLTQAHSTSFKVLQQHTKKDGTADKRYKENKQTKHLKKDGTPDKRYKENKAPKGHLTRSGKPDMRYKSNNPDAGKKKKHM
jgi:hypothetical protein